jgi:hypothetical protein
MTRREWVNTCAKRINGTVRDWPQSLSMAGQCAEKQSWENGASGLAWEKPEDLAERAIEEYKECLND